MGTNPLTTTLPLVILFTYTTVRTSTIAHGFLTIFNTTGIFTTGTLGIYCKAESTNINT